MPKSLGDRLKAVRMRKKLTQEKLCEEAGIHPKYLSEIERGNKVPSVTVLWQLAMALQVPLCELVPQEYCPYKGKTTRNDNAFPDGANHSKTSRLKQG